MINIIHVSINNKKIKYVYNYFCISVMYIWVCVYVLLYVCVKEIYIINQPNICFAFKKY